MSAVVLPNLIFMNQAAFSTFTQDAATDALAFKFTAKVATPIKKVQWHITTKTGTPHDLQVLLTADVNGAPEISGSLPVDIGGGSPTLVSVANAALATGVNTATLTNAYTPTIGTAYWVVLWPGTTGGSAWSGSHRYIHLIGSSNIGGVRAGQCWSTTDTGATWADGSTNILSLSLQDASDNYLPTFASAVFSSTTASVTPASGSSPNEYGAAFAVPSGQTLSIHGANWLYRLSSATTSDHVLEAWTAPFVAPVSLVNYTVDVSSFCPVAASNRNFLYRWPAGPYLVTPGQVVGCSQRASGAGTVEVAQVIFHSQAAKEAALYLKDWYGMDRSGGAGVFTARPDRIYSVAAWYGIEPVRGIDQRRDYPYGRQRVRRAAYAA